MIGNLLLEDVSLGIQEGSVKSWLVSSFSEFFFRWSMSSSERTEDRSGDISARSIASFLDISLRDNVSLSPNDDRYEITVETSQFVEYLGFGGRSFAITFISRMTRRCYPTGLRSIQGCTDDMTERRTFTVRYYRLF